MPTSRSYQDNCAIARALDVVGERWAMLVVRELLLGPQRFSEIRHALAGASSNLVTDRLRELQGHGVIRRRKLGPPAGSWVYELTGWGRELEPVVLALGGWGLRAPFPSGPVTLSAVSVLLFLRGSVRPGPGMPADRYRFDLDGQVWTVRTEAGQVHVGPGDPGEPGEPAGAVAGFRGSPLVLNAALADPGSLDAAIAAGDAALTGDGPALRRLLQTASG